MEPIYKITDERFDVSRIDQYDLCIEAGTGRFRFFLRSALDSTVIWLEDYYLRGGGNFAEGTEMLEKIYADHGFLQASFWNNVHVSLITPFHLICPEELFMPDREKDYLNTVFDYRLSEGFLFGSKWFGQSGLLFGYPEYLRAFFSGKYPVDKISFQMSAAKASSHLINGADPENTVHIYLDDTYITFYFVDPRHGIQAERFPLSSDDYTELVRNFENRLCFVFGELTLYSPVFRTLQGLCRNIKFGTHPNGINFSQYFQDMPQHRYAGLFLT